MTPFLKIVADDIYEKFNGRLEDIAIVFPNKRACLFFSEYLLKKNGGKVQCKDGKSVRVLSKKTSYPVILASCCAGVATMILSLVLGGVVAYYLIYVMIAWLFALLVYYTVKMM